MTITCPVNDTTGVCGVMDSAGAGLGIFIQYMGSALPVLLIILAMVGIIVAVGYGIASVIKGGLARVK
jgi:F0F1-type ATP synthase assembly protein I